MRKTKSTRVPRPHIYTVEKVMTKKELEAEVKRLGECNQNLLFDRDAEMSRNRRSWSAWRTLVNWNIIAVSAVVLAIIVKVWVLA